jgi:hypothetical protein
VQPAVNTFSDCNASRTDCMTQFEGTTKRNGDSHVAKSPVIHINY